MIDRQGNKIIFECDSCDTTEERHADEDFGAVWAALRAEGWRVKKIGDEWVHGCPKCGV